MATDSGAVAVVVVGLAAEQVVRTLGGARGGASGAAADAAHRGAPLPSPAPVAALVLQEPRLGTGHAVVVALEAAVAPSWQGAVLVLCAHTPGVDGALLAGLLHTPRRFMAADAGHDAKDLTSSPPQSMQSCGGF